MADSLDGSEFTGTITSLGENWFNSRRSSRALSATAPLLSAPLIFLPSLPFPRWNLSIVSRFSFSLPRTFLFLFVLRFTPLRFHSELPPTPTRPFFPFSSPYLFVLFLRALFPFSSLPLYSTFATGRVLRHGFSGFTRQECLWRCQMSQPGIDASSFFCSTIRFPFEKIGPTTTYTSSIISTYLVTWQTRYTRLLVSNTAYTIHFPLRWTMSTVMHSEFWKIYFSGDMRQWTRLLLSNAARIIRFALGVQRICIYS